LRADGFPGVTLFDQGRVAPTGELGFATATLRRAAELRDREDVQRQLLADPTARAVVIAADTPVLAIAGGRPEAFHRPADGAAMGHASEAAFLGFDDLGPIFGLHLPQALAEDLKTRQDLKLIDMRSVAIQGLFDPGTTNAIGTAKALFSWHQRHRFCANCGKPTRVASAGWKRICEPCGTEHFPRTDPVVIMLAVHGDRCLMGRAPRFPATMYSCLAGFMEPGETIEDAVRREIKEEAGIDTARVAYLDCQPWPFPSSLMIGCIAEATSTEITLDDELADARWFTRDEVRLILAGQHPDGISCPPRMAIANHLMRAFVDG
jgi:NAD+ diphosphatase